MKKFIRSALGINNQYSSKGSEKNRTGQRESVGYDTVSIEASTGMTLQRCPEICTRGLDLCISMWVYHKTQPFGDAAFFSPGNSQRVLTAEATVILPAPKGSSRWNIIIPTLTPIHSSVISYLHHLQRKYISSYL